MSGKLANMSSSFSLRRFFHMTVAPAILMILVPNFSVCITYLVVHKSSNFQLAKSEGFLTFWSNAWLNSAPTDLKAWYAIGGMLIWAASSLLFLGGRRYRGPPTKNGFMPTYVDSGFTYYIFTMIGIVTVFAFPNLLSAWYWYKKGSALAGALVVLGFLFSFLLWAKGHLAPSLGEHGSSGNPLFDFYWGMELYPRLGSRFDLKMWFSCRFGMMMWQLVVLFCWKAQFEHSGWNWSMASSVLLQTIYIAKFFWRDEEFYLKGIDSTLDRAGFYICWGFICWVPTFFTLTSLYLVENAPAMTPVTFALVVAVSIGSAGLNYWVDYQRQITRATGGKCSIWGRPAKILRATYIDYQNRERTSILLASGFWGLSRHMNYVFELCIALAWTLPAVVGSSSNLNILPFCYFIFLLVVVVHRSFRDDWKCQQKYGKDWEAYCRLVPYKLLPWVF